jgi:hypothetical protein
MTFRPFIDGRPYSTVMVAPSIVAFTVSCGLLRCSCACATVAAHAAMAVKVAIVFQIRIMFSFRV